MTAFLNIPVFVVALCALWTGDQYLIGISYGALGLALLWNMVEVLV